MTDAITREHRTQLLTRRVRAVMRAFNKNPKYLSGAIPNISWDDSFIPPELYENLQTELASLVAKENQQVQKEKERERENEKERENKKARENQRRKMEEQMANDTEKPKKKLARKTCEPSLFGSTTGNNKDGIPSDEAEPTGVSQNDK